MTESPRKLRLGMVGGGPGSNNGATHRTAASVDGRYELVRGVFAINAQRSQEFAASLEIPVYRRYTDWQEMTEKETKRANCIEVISIITLYNSHYAIANNYLYEVTGYL
ncbi:MAG: Gfo/Idh/MocA family oxidoreductase [Caldilineaceae bacterium]